MRVFASFDGVCDMHPAHCGPKRTAAGESITGVVVVVCAALEGFSYVPQLHPLETLHNTLTYREVDDFLGRITSTRFPMPAISPTMVANRPSLMLVSPNKCELSPPPPPPMVSPNKCELYFSDVEKAAETDSVENPKSIHGTPLQESGCTQKVNE